MRLMLWKWPTVLSVLLLVGCASSNVAAWRQAHATDYAALSAADKAAVDKGKVREGMSTNAVLIAWGRPDIVSTMSTPNGPFVIWEYYRKRTITTPSPRREAMVPWSSTPVPDSRLFPNTAPTFSTSVVETLEHTAAFHNERLVNWSPR